MLCSIRQYSRCGVRSQMWSVWIRNSSSLEVAKNTFPLKASSMCGDEEQEEVKLMLNYFKCGDEERIRRLSECREFVSARSKLQVKWSGIAGDWKEIEGDWKEVEAGWREIEAECRGIEAEYKKAPADSSKVAWACTEAKAADIKAKAADIKAEAARNNAKAVEANAK